MAARKRPVGNSGVREVSWAEICIPDDRKDLEISSTNHPDEEMRLVEQCECGAALTFVRAEAGYRREATCCCGRCATAYLMVVGACRGCGCEDCAGAEPCPLLNEEMGHLWWGEECEVFLKVGVPV